MPQTTTLCPRCRQPVTADIEKLFDMNTDPRAKQRLLSGSANFVRCPSCGYEGPISTPIVYHDPEKELLLTYFPPEMGLPVNEQERLMGPMITQVTNKLPPEKRKAYLLRPQTMFTYDTLIERILEGDGITKDMLQAQQQRLALLQRILSSSPESRPEIITQEKALIDEDFFALLSRVTEASLAQGDQNTARALAGLQKQLLETTDVGKTLQAQAQEAEAAVKSLQEASKNGLTREVLLEMMVDAKTDIRLNTLVSLTRSGMDYAFFQLLSDRIEQASVEEKPKLIELREKLLKMTQEIDQALAQQMDHSRQVLEAVVNAPNIEEAIAANAQQIDEFFVQSLKDELQKARQASDFGRSAKLQQVMDTLQKMTAPPPEVAFIDELMGAEDDASLNQMIESNSEKISDELLQLLNGVLNQSEQQGQPPEVIDQLRKVYRAVLRFTMRKNLA